MDTEPQGEARRQRGRMANNLIGFLYWHDYLHGSAYSNCPGCGKGFVFDFGTHQTRAGRHSGRLALVKHHVSRLSDHELKEHLLVMSMLDDPRPGPDFIGLDRQWSRTWEIR